MNMAISRIKNLFTGFERKTLLWTNSNVNSSFAGQDVTLDLTNYSGVEILFFSPNNSAFTTVLNYYTARAEKNRTSAGICIVGVNTTTNALQVYMRRFTMRNDAIAFWDCDYLRPSSAPSTGNTYCVPAKIYGIRHY